MRALYFGLWLGLALGCEKQRSSKEPPIEPPASLLPQAEALEGNWGASAFDGNCQFIYRFDFENGSEAGYMLRIMCRSINEGEAFVEYYKGKLSRTNDKLSFEATSSSCPREALVFYPETLSFTLKSDTLTLGEQNFLKIPDDLLSRSLSGVKEIPGCFNYKFSDFTATGRAEDA